MAPDLRCGRGRARGDRRPSARVPPVRARGRRARRPPDRAPLPTFASPFSALEPGILQSFCLVTTLTAFVRPSCHPGPRTKNGPAMGAGSEPQSERKVVNRTFDAQGLIVLPKLDAGSAFSIGEALITRAKEEQELAEPIADEVKKMKHAVAELG